MTKQDINVKINFSEVKNYLRDIAVVILLLASIIFMAAELYNSKRGKEDHNKTLQELEKLELRVDNLEKALENVSKNNNKPIPHPPLPFDHFRPNDSEENHGPKK